MDQISNKVRFIIAGVGLAVITISALFWVLGDERKILFSGLSQDTLVEYTAKLEAEGIQYDVEESSILVATSDVNQARVVTMQDRVYNGQTVGLELYENSDFGATEKAQQANYIRALQGEIERTLTAFQYIKKARVHLSLPQKRLFATQQSQAKASVTLFPIDHYKPRQADIKSIKQLVASAVEDLSVEQVVVIDGAGQWGIMDNQIETEHPALALRKSTETYLEQKIYQVLTPYFSSDQISASVAVDLTTDRVKTQQTKAIKADEGQGLINTEVKVEETQLDAGLKPESKSMRREVSYVHGSLTQETEQLPGQIIRLTAAVSINSELDPERQKELVQLIENTVGFNKLRNDSVSVSFFAIPKTEPIVISPQKPIFIPQLEPVETNVWPFIVGGLGTLFSSIIGLFYLLHRREKNEQSLLAQLNYLFDEEGQHVNA